jgi:hypothetical protein
MKNQVDEDPQCSTSGCKSHELSLSLRLSHFSLQTLQEMLKSEASGEECAQERVYDLGFTIKKAAP